MNNGILNQKTDRKAHSRFSPSPSRVLKKDASLSKRDTSLSTKKPKKKEFEPRKKELEPRKKELELKLLGDGEGGWELHERAGGGKWALKTRSAK